MNIYELSYNYFVKLIQEAALLLDLNLQQSAVFLFSLSILATLILLNRKVKKLERIQINDIVDITSFNHLIDDEIGILRKEYDDLSQAIMKKNKQGKSTEDKLFNNTPYTQAVLLAQRGYARDEIISLCSLTESEAELILALHANSKAA